MMLYSTKGIVLHRFKYSDSKIIIKIFTEKFGLQSYLFFVSKSAKHRSKLNLLQPMFFLDLNVYHKETVDLQKIKDFQSGKIYTSVPFDVIKQTISFFCAEFLLKTLEENSKDKELFHFLSEKFEELDLIQNNTADFPTYFLYHLTEHLGIKPEENYSDSMKIFDLQKGRFITGRPTHPNFLNETESQLIYELSKTKSLNAKHYSINQAARKSILNNLIKYYNIHLDRPGKIKSLTVLNQVFS